MVVPHLFKLGFKRKDQEVSSTKYLSWVNNYLPKMSFQCVNIDTGHVSKADETVDTVVDRTSMYVFTIYA